MVPRLSRQSPKYLRSGSCNSGCTRRAVGRSGCCGWRGGTARSAPRRPPAAGGGRFLNAWTRPGRSTPRGGARSRPPSCEAVRCPAGPGYRFCLPGPSVTPAWTGAGPAVGQPVPSACPTLAVATSAPHVRSRLLDAAPLAGSAGDADDPQNHSPGRRLCARLTRALGPHVLSGHPRPRWRRGRVRSRPEP